MTATARNRIRTVLRIMLGALLLWAAVSKLANPSEFLASIYGYELPLPKLWFQAIAVVLPWVELICGLLLLGNIWPDTALICITGLFVMFLFATGQAWARGLNISCGCFNLSIFGISETNPNLVKFIESVGFAFFRNLVLTAISFFLLKSRLAELKAAVAPIETKSTVVPKSPTTPQKMSKQQRRHASVK